MIGRMHKLARKIDAFVANPLINLIKGMILLMIGLSDASHSFRDDMTHGHIRVGHGLMLIGVFGILGSLPHVLDGLAAGARYVEGLAEKDLAPEQESKP